MLLTIASLAAGVLCVLAYARSERLFAWANATLWPIVALDAFLAGAYGSTLLAGMFGAVGTWKLWRRFHPKYGSHAYHVKAYSEFEQSILDRKLREAGGPLTLKEDL